MRIHSRVLKESDLDEMRNLILREGPNDWNFLSEESIDHQFQLIRKGRAIAVIAEVEYIIGFAVLIHGESCPSKLEKYTDLSLIDYIDDVVVSKTYKGKGIGCRLLNECVSIAKKRKSTAVYIERHEENSASAGMMRKAGFEAVETYYDPKKRFVGSQKTSILKKYT